ncbi:uncharacterized protein LOC131035589 isoform X2 [Cryptomeria japonica]|nr:uncharacterized protein LOC131035589 isoform X2 [Cryptomeria japonica]
MPVCGDCLCQPEHSTCEIKTYSEWVVDGDGVDELSPKCSLCSENICATHPVIRLSCLHILHTGCLLDLLQSPPSEKGYTCSSCGSQIWPPNKHLVNSSSALCKRIEDLLVQSIKLNMNSEALLPLRSESSLNSTDKCNDEKFLVPNLAPEVTVPIPVTSLATLHGDQPILQMLVKNNIHSERNFSAENGKNISISSRVIDIEPANSISTEFVAKAVGSPKLSKLLSRKLSRNDRKTNEFRFEDDTDKGGKYTPRGSQIESMESLLQSNSPKKMILPVTAPTQYKETDSHLNDLSNGRFRRYRPTASLDPRKILFIFATLSSMGTMILIYLTLTVGKMDKNLLQVDAQ